jgi:hypothetical protein
LLETEVARSSGNRDFKKKPQVARFGVDPQWIFPRPSLYPADPDNATV